MADPYASIAPIYDEWHEALGIEWVPRLENHLTRYGNTGDKLSLLDLGCGTGTLLMALRARHPSWELTGLDASAAMLAEAQRKPRADTIRWIHGTMESLPALEIGRFDVVGSFFDAFNHLLPDGALAQAFQSAAAALIPGGLLIFDLNNRRGCEDRSQTRASADRGTWEVASHSAFDPVAGIETTQVTVRLQQGPPAQTVIRRRCFASDEVASALDAAGFAIELEETWSFARGAVAGKTWYVARKRGALPASPPGRAGHAARGRAPT